MLVHMFTNIIIISFEETKSRYNAIVIHTSTVTLSEIQYSCNNLEINYKFSCINVCQFPRKMLKTEEFACCFLTSSKRPVEC